jgi:glycerophosphoryl diester phosphodiesterase
MSGMQMVGHRGARFEAPENTLSGFRYAIGIGITAVEFDVRMTADNELVIIHDETVDRTTNGRGNVSDLTLAEIQSLDARSAFPDWPEPCMVPTLAQVLEVVAGLPELIIEIKRDTPERLERIVRATTAEVERMHVAEQVTITSFAPEALAIVQRVAPQIRRGYIGDWDSRHFLDTSVELGCTQIDVHHPTGDHELVSEAKARGMRVICWPTNSPEDLENVLTFQPDLFCTDSPTRMRELAAHTVT